MLSIINLGPECVENSYGHGPQFREEEFNATTNLRSCQSGGSIAVSR